MQRFHFEHDFPADPEIFIRIMDDPAYRSFLGKEISGIVRTEQEILEDTPEVRCKRLVTAPYFKFPARIERILKNYTLSVEQLMVLNKREFRESVSWETGFGQFQATALYEPGPSGGTHRIYEGQFRCTISIIGKVVESLVLRQMKAMYDREAEATIQFLQQSRES